MEKENAVIEKSTLIKCPHGFSTRLGGVSEGIYASLNLGMNRGDDKERVIKNWDLFLEASGIKTKEFVCGEQVHGNHVHIATTSDLRPAYGPGFMNTADGYVTIEENVPLAIFTADCVPILIEDPVRKAVGAVHSGWRSTVADIEKSAVDALILLGSDPQNLKIAIGPAIDRCCFEVGAEVIDGINSLLGPDAPDFYNLKPNGKYMLDLRGAVKHRFTQLGVPMESIELVGTCTMCHPERYYSHRFTNGARGSLAAVISL